MTDLTAIAMENLRSGLTNFWFMMKASHQLRSPLNTVTSMLKTVTDGYLGPITDAQQETIEKCRKRIRILGDLINDLLKLGEKKSETARPVFYPVDLAKIMNQMVDFYQSQAAEKGLDLSFQIHDQIPKVMANEKIIDELFTNLLSNAIKYTPQSGEVCVLLAREGQDHVRLEVSDTGIGIAEEEIPRLFTEFFRTETAKTLVEEGTGLGLVIVQEILDLLGGTIHVESKLGQGTCFSCLLPSLPQS
jgi:signal transduction histidine kinase